MLGTLLGFLARSALMQSPIGAFLKGCWSLLGKLPWQVWAVFFAAIALWLGIRWHGHEVHKTWQSGYNQARSEDRAELDRLRAELKTAGEKMATVSRDQRSKNDAANRDIRNAAAAIGLQGPGAARCSGRAAAAVSPAPGGHEPANRPADPAPTPMPAENGPDALAAVPWRWLVGTGGQCDLERAENLSWRNAYVGWVAEWEKVRAHGDKPPRQ